MVHASNIDWRPTRWSNHIGLWLKMERGNFAAAAGFGMHPEKQGVFSTFAAFLEMCCSEITMARLNRSNVFSHFSHSGVDDMADNTCHFGINNMFAGECELLLLCSSAPPLLLLCSSSAPHLLLLCSSSAPPLLLLRSSSAPPLLLCSSLRRAARQLAQPLRCGALGLRRGAAVCLSLLSTLMGCARLRRQRP